MPPLINKLAVFDIDGTLTDSVSQHQSAFIKALNLLNYKNYSTDWGTYPHHTDLAIFKEICAHHEARGVQAEEIACFEQLITETLTATSRIAPVQQIQDAALFLKRLGIQYDIVFATGSLLKPALLKLQQAGIHHPEALVVSSNNFCSREEIVNHAIEVAKDYYGRTHYSRILSFGDGPWDLWTARTLGLEFIGIRNDGLVEHGVTHFFPHFRDDALYRLLEIELPAYS